MTTNAFGPAKGYFGPEVKGFGALNQGAPAPPSTSFWLLEDGASFWLLEDGTTMWALEQ